MEAPRRRAYVTKPFGVDEVLARLRAALRRSQAGEPSPLVVRFGEVEVDMGRVGPGIERRPPCRPACREP